MKIFTSKHELQQYLLQCRQNGETIGLLPTMGALHQGHLSLLALARQQCSVTVCSIFVNPTQFTNPDDLQNYPRPIEADIAKLTAAGCDILFNPSVSEMYAANEQWHIDLGQLEHLLEGKFRPGHYQGVTQVVFKLFDIVKPDAAFFGQKDYQQVLVITKMVQLLNMPVKLVMVPISREPEGLAMSSRNIHLSAGEREHALIVSKALRWVAENFNGENLQQVTGEAIAMINAETGVVLEYFEIADGDTLLPATEANPHLIALTAVQAGKTRLIDNMIIR
ncbi:pantoate--beta-alanine ligase [Mucilaginibacter polytrichastri]|uniref:Pantothenate synthetase n=1 Tax=Mucilaginibacter polytrichastri TaxID=1302689 RepID=A0A1Q6A5Y2_9SPHI|nr:pantoate--beta-alanine ligase [Mucilaginibacter polytrichastri]OKS89406.1 Pantothenate synthetase [Mucilaginibacter polytrichastri]SFS73107.1 pantoate--beta-alanine ligase [Mucilaginibacter polytrichastri]